MKLLLTAILLVHFTVAAQTDSSHIKRIPFDYLRIDGEYLCVHLSKAEIIQSDSVWNIVQKRCKAVTTTRPDFTQYTVWQRTSNGDCHARFTHELFMDTEAKKMIWVEYNHYGGCRAGKSRQFRIQFPIPPGDYTFERRVMLKDKSGNGRWLQSN